MYIVKNNTKSVMGLSLGGEAHDEAGRYMPSQLRVLPGSNEIEDSAWERATAGNGMVKRMLEELMTEDGRFLLEATQSAGGFKGMKPSQAIAFVKASADYKFLVEALKSEDRPTVAQAIHERIAKIVKVATKAKPDESEAQE